jgi:integrase/recombinase XerD
MPRVPWEVTREMFLDEREVATLLGAVREAARSVVGRGRMPARLDELIIEGLLFSGLRSSEFCGLTLGDTVIGHGLSAFVVRTPPARARTVHLPQRVADLVRGYAQDLRPRLLPAGVDAHDLGQPFLFNERCRPYKRTGLYRRVVRILDRAGLGRRASIQLLRHTYGYLAYLRTGGNLLFVQRQLGHAHPMVSMVYARFVQESYAGLADRVGAPDAGPESLPANGLPGGTQQESSHDR